MRRRRFLVLAAGAAGLAGCSSSGDPPSASATDTAAPTTTATATGTRTDADAGTATETKTATDAGTATETRSATDTETATETRTATETESTSGTGGSSGGGSGGGSSTATPTETPASDGGITFEEQGRSTSNGYEVDTTVTNDNSYDVTVSLDVHLLDENGNTIADQQDEQVVTAGSTWEETFTFDQSGDGHEVEFTVSE